MKKSSKIVLIITAVIIVALLAIGAIWMLNRNNTDQAAEQVDEQGTGLAEAEKIDIAELKKYLEENYDKFTIDGSTSMIPLHTSLNALFSSTEESVYHNKTVEAFERFIAGENDVLIGVDYSDELFEQARVGGVKLVKKEITKEAFVFLINKNNPVKNLTINQIKDIYSGKITNWSEVGGDDAPIKAYQRNSDSGSQMRMNKFMGSTKLMETDVEYISAMGTIIESVGDYDNGKYSIAYNMYTFTEKQYPSDEVILLSVDGVYPDDDAVFAETYPINIYNYVYYDENNEAASEFANNLYNYLMSEEGQKLISDSGYVNLNIKYDRSKDTVDFYESNTYEFDFYDEKKGEFYTTDEAGNLVVFDNYPDYALYYQPQYKDNAKVREYIMFIFNSDIEKNENMVGVGEGTVNLDPWFDASMDPNDFFKFKHEGKYYTSLIYYIDEDKYVLENSSSDIFNSYMEEGYLEGFTEYVNNFTPGAKLEITKEELKNLYLRTFERSETKIEFFQPFK